MWETNGLSLTVQGGAISIGECDVIQGGKRHKRSVVSKFSEPARKRLLRWCSASVARFTTLLTLTIPHVEMSGPIFKSKLDRILVWLKAQADVSFPGQSWTALWVLEFQGRGAAHVHVLLTHPIDKERVQVKWALLWQQRIFELCEEGAYDFGRGGAVLANGREVVEKMRAAACNIKSLSERHHALDYLSQYAGKVAQKSLPDVLSGFGRWWGVRGDRAEESRTTLEVWPLPADPVNRTGLLIDFSRQVMASVKMFAKKTRCIPWSRGLGWTILQRCSDLEWSECVSAFCGVAAALGFVPKGTREDWKDVVRCRLYGVEVATGLL